MTTNIRKIFVTNALPFANGDIHLGHLLGYVQADIWVRYQRMSGAQVHYVCADDTHGTPIMIKAESLGITPETLIRQAHEAHYKDFQDFSISFDNYYSTHSEENKMLVEDIYLKLRDAGLIEVKEIKQFFDEEKAMFLPDRFIKGECPKCHAKDQYGDNCEVCGGVYQPTELIEPFSVVSGKTPVMKPSQHYFFKLSDDRCVAFLRSFLQDTRRLQPEAANKMREWIGEEGDNKLSDWDISRDAPYFGFPIPDVSEKYFYVWLDAPVGYFASLKQYSTRNPAVDFNAYVSREGSEVAGTEMIHFIGKDIMYFHTLFWPAMLNFSGYRVPSQYAINGFLTVNGAKMSKSRGTFITARSYLDQKLNPEWLRYYFAAKSSGSIDDLDLNMDDFVNRVNADLVGKFVNIASRTSRFVSRNFNNTLSVLSEETAELILAIRGLAPKIYSGYESRNYAQILRDVAHACDLVNEHFDGTKPWELAKENASASRLQALCTGYLEAFRILSLYLNPVIPETVKAIESYLASDLSSFAHLENTLEGKTIHEYEHLLKRIERPQLEQLVEANKAALNVVRKDTPTIVPEKEASLISIDDFSKVELRLGKVLSCDFIEGSDKLLKFEVDLGESKPRNIFSGIREFYAKPHDLVGRYVVVVANLAPRKMRFGTSEGMILTAASDASLSLLTTMTAIVPGARIS